MEVMREVRVLDTAAAVAFFISYRYSLDLYHLLGLYFREFSVQIGRRVRMNCLVYFSSVTLSSVFAAQDFVCDC